MKAAVIRLTSDSSLTAPMRAKCLSASIASASDLQAPCAAGLGFPSVVDNQTQRALLLRISDLVSLSSHRPSGILQQWRPYYARDKKAVGAVTITGVDVPSGHSKAEKSARCKVLRNAVFTPLWVPQQSGIAFRVPY